MFMIVATMITTIMPITAGTKYMSAIDSAGGGVAVVGGASSTYMAVSACEPYYALAPSKRAMTIYLPGTGGSTVAL